MLEVIEKNKNLVEELNVKNSNVIVIAINGQICEVEILNFKIFNKTSIIPQLHGPPPASTY